MGCSTVRALPGARALDSDTAVVRLQAGTNQAVACLISDICMPGMDGFALEHRIAKERPELSVILIAGDGAAWAEGVKRFTRAQKRTKPFDMKLDGFADGLFRLLERGPAGHAAR